MGCELARQILQVETSKNSQSPLALPGGLFYFGDAQHFHHLPTFTSIFRSPKKCAFYILLPPKFQFFDLTRNLALSKTRVTGTTSPQVYILTDDYIDVK